MLNPLNFLSKFIKSSNQKELDRIAKIVEKVNSFEDKIKKLSSEEFPRKTLELKDKLNAKVHYEQLVGRSFCSCERGF